MNNKNWNDAAVLGPFLLDSATALLRSGASTGRIETNMLRLAKAGGFWIDITIHPISVSISLMDELGTILFTGNKSIPAQGVNFKVVSGISRMSWDILEGKYDFNAAKIELGRLLGLPHYNRWLILVMVSLAGAAFCFTFGGDALQMGIGFFATFIGLFCKQEMLKRAYNTYIITYISACFAALTVGLFHLLLQDIKMEHAFSTCVLFLIPGVPLINAITDLIEGHTLNGIARGVGALLHAFAIAFGLVTILYLLGFL